MGLRLPGASQVKVVTKSGSNRLVGSLPPIKTLPNVTSGNYTITFELKYFKNGLAAEGGLKLEVDRVFETVIVSGESPLTQKGILALSACGATRYLRL